MKIALDIGASRSKALDAIAKAAKRTRASIVREAIDEYLAQRSDRVRDDAFGLWGDHGVDGLDYQKRMRRLW